MCGAVGLALGESSRLGDIGCSHTSVHARRRIRGGVCECVRWVLQRGGSEGATSQVRLGGDFARWRDACVGMIQFVATCVHAASCVAVLRCCCVFDCVEHTVLV